MEQQETNKYKESEGSMFVNLIMEAVNYIAVIVSLVLTFSVAMLMDTLTSTCSFLRATICFYINKKFQKNLKFSYNYGTDRLEGLTALFCDCLLSLGAVIVMGVAIYRIFVPSKVSGLIFVAVIFKAICVIADIAILIPAYTSYKKTRTKIARNLYNGLLGSLLIDSGIFLGVVLSMILKNWTGVRFAEPVISIIVCAYIIINAVKSIREGIRELSDLTLDEASQMKILKVVSAHFDEFESLLEIDSHKFGEKVFIDLEFAFPPNSTYKEIKTFLKDVSTELETDFPENEISLKIMAEGKDSTVE